jgi:hypothetical protein
LRIDVFDGCASFIASGHLDRDLSGLRDLDPVLSELHRRHHRVDLRGRLVLRVHPSRVS